MTNRITSHTINQTSDNTTVMMPGVEAPLSCSNMGDLRDYPEHTGTDHLQHTDIVLEYCQAVRCREEGVEAVEGIEQEQVDEFFPVQTEVSTVIFTRLPVLKR